MIWEHLEPDVQRVIGWSVAIHLGATGLSSAPRGWSRAYPRLGTQGATRT